MSIDGLHECRCGRKCTGKTDTYRQGVEDAVKAAEKIAEKYLVCCGYDIAAEIRHLLAPEDE